VRPAPIPLLPLLAALLAPLAARAEDDLPMRAMKDELARTMAELRLGEMERPYFGAYRMDDADVLSASAVLGGLTASQRERSRRFTVELRLGNNDLDDSNYVGSRTLGREGSGGAWGPLDDDYREIRRQLWRATDTRYKAALESLTGKRAVLQANRRAEAVPDFSRESPQVIAGPWHRTGVTRADLEAMARELSAVFRAHPEIIRSSVKVEARDLHTRFANSEGSSFTRSAPLLQVQVAAETRSGDGLPVSDSLEVQARSAAELPPLPELLARTRALASGILQLRIATSLERYSGPVLFEDVAAAEVFSQQFATALVAIRQPLSDDPRFDAFYGQVAAQFGGGSFLDKLGGRVLPEFLGVSDQPLLRELGGSPLLGGQPVDDDGVIPREVRLVEKGILKTLLTTRIPVRGLRTSTGSRRGAGPAPSNLVVTTASPLPAAELRRLLLERARARGLDHAIVVRRVGAGGAGGPLARLASRMAATALPGSNAMAEVLRLHLDGREEPLRGVELAELTAASFREVVAAGDRPVVFHGEYQNLLTAMFAGDSPWGGATGPLVSCVAPALLFDEVTLAGSRGPFPTPHVSSSPLAAP